MHQMMIMPYGSGSDTTSQQNIVGFSRVGSQ